MSDWRPGDIALTKLGTVLERDTDDPYSKLPRWLQISPVGFPFEGYDPDDAILLARRVGDKRLPVIDLEGMSGKAPCYHPNGVTWAGNCVDCAEPVGENLFERPDGAA